MLPDVGSGTKFQESARGPPLANSCHQQHLATPPAHVPPPIKKQNRGSPECAFCTPLCTFSVLTYALTDKKTSKWQDSTLCILPLGHAKLQTDDKTQLSASLPWGMQNCKQKLTKETTLCLRHSGPVGLLGFLGFLSCLSLFLFFLFYLFLFFVFLVFSFCMNVSLSWLPVCFCEHFAVLSLLTLPFPIIPHHERSAHAYSATPLDIIQMCMFFWFSHGLGTLPQSYLKKCEKIEHSHDLKI